MHRKKNKFIDKGSYYEILLNSRKGILNLRTKVDKSDWDLVSVCSWSNSKTVNRPQGFVNGKLTTIHQLLMGNKKGFVIDHINHDGYDNRRSNLRFATKSQNSMNQSGVAGVHEIKSRPNLKKVWLMQIKSGSKRFKSYHYTREEAVAARKKAEAVLFGEFAFGALSMRNSR